MSNEIKIEGSFNIPIQNIGEGANVEVIQILAKSYAYNDLLDRLKTKQELFDLVPEENIEKRLQLSAEINQLKEVFEQFKRDVLALAETFSKIEINTDRLRRAKEFFDKGEIGETRAWLNNANEEIESEEIYLWAAREKYKNKIESKLIQKAEERLIQALLSQLDYSNPNYYEETCFYFERSIESYINGDNIILYGVFLQKRNRFKEAENLYLTYLPNFSHKLQQDKYAFILSNLAILHTKRNRFDEALKEYEQASSIYHELSKSYSM